MKDIIYIAIGLTLAVILGVFFNYYGDTQLDIGSLISWALAGAMILIMIGIVVCSFLLAKPLSKKIKL
jgi:hypothetical protein